MISALHDANIFSLDGVYQSMLRVDTSAPESLQFMPQRFWLAQPLVSVADNILDKLIDPSEDLLVRLFPVQIVFPCEIGKDLIHLPLHPRLPRPYAARVYGQHRASIDPSKPSDFRNWPDCCADTDSP